MHVIWPIPIDQIVSNVMPISSNAFNGAAILEGVNSFNKARSRGLGRGVTLSEEST